MSAEITSTSVSENAEPNAGSTHSGTDAEATESAAPESASAAADSSDAEAGSTDSDLEATDDTEAEETDGASAEGAGADGAVADGTAKKRRRRKRKKKPASGEAKPTSAAARNKPATERAPFHVGEDVFGLVTAVLDHAIMVNLAGKALAVFDRGEMASDDLVPEVGDRFVARVHQDGARGGLVVLTRKPMREEEAKPKVEQAAKEGAVILGLVTGVVKGGVDVDIDGLRAFAPASGMDLHPQNANFAALVGQQLDFKVLQYEKGGRDVVVTRRPMLEAEAHVRRKKALELLQEGQVLPAVVRTVVEWGVFVALPQAENLEGLIHVSEASHDPRARLTELFSPGDKFDVKITKIDERGKIWLSRKALVEDPWAEAKEKYLPGKQFKGKVTRVESFGAFVQVEDVEGLIHLGDLSFKRLEHADEVLKVGDEIDVVVNQFDFKNKKMSFYPAPDPAHAAEEKQKVVKNQGVRVEVLRAEPVGVHVRITGVIGRQARGFIPAGQTGTLRDTDLRKKFPAGTFLQAKIVEIDPRRGEAKLSIKQLGEDEERQAHRDYRKQLAKEGGFGTLGDLLARKLK
jgi:small subunit ribosomal protein S1